MKKVTFAPDTKFQHRCPALQQMKLNSFVEALQQQLRVAHIRDVPKIKYMLHKALLKKRKCI